MNTAKNSNLGSVRFTLCDSHGRFLLKCSTGMNQGDALALICCCLGIPPTLISIQHFQPLSVDIGHDVDVFGAVVAAVTVRSPQVFLCWSWWRCSVY